MFEVHASLKVDKTELHEIAITLIKNKNSLVKDWLMFHNELCGENSNIVQWKNLFNNEILTSYELFMNILEYWYSQNGNGATFGALDQSLTAIGKTAAAESLKSYVCSQTVLAQGLGDLEAINNEILNLNDEVLNQFTKSNISRLLRVWNNEVVNDALLKKYRKMPKYISVRLYDLGMYTELFHFSFLSHKRLTEVLPADPETLKMQQHLAKALDAKGEWERSRVLLKNLLHKQRRIRPQNHTLIGATVNSYVAVLIQNSESEKAREILEKLVILIDDHFLPWMFNFASVLREEGKLDIAKTIYKQVKKWQKEELGEKHLHTLATQQDIGIILFKQNRYPKAKKQFEIVCELRREILSEEHPHSSRTLFWLGLTQFKLGEAKTSVRTLQQAYRVQRNILGDVHPHTKETKLMIKNIRRSSGGARNFYNLLIPVNN